MSPFGLGKITGKELNCINRYTMKIFSKVIVFALFVSFPLGSWAYGDKFVKWVAQGDISLYGYSCFDVGLGVNFGRDESKINLQTTINYGQFSTSENEEEGVDNLSNVTRIGLLYHRVSIPVELYYMIGEDADSRYFVGAGVVSNYNMSGRVFVMDDTENFVQLNDGLNRYNFAARVSAGMTMMGYVGLKGFVDFNLTPHLKKYSISDRLFEYEGPIETAFTNLTFGLSMFLTF